MIGLLILLLLGFQAPESNWAGQAGAQPNVRVTARLVTVNVVAQDKDGKPVTDLKQEEFRVLDQGQAQAISLFSREGGGPPLVSPPEFPYSNRRNSGAAPGAGGATVILLDSLNTEIADVQYARGQLIKFLEQIRPGERVAVYTLVHRLAVLHHFSEDSASLLRALKAYESRFTTGLAKAETPSETGIEPHPEAKIKEPIDAYLDKVSQKTADTATRDRVRRTADAIIQAAQAMAGLPGRKNLIWVSGGFPWQIGFDQGQMKMDDVREANIFYEEIEQISRALNNADVAIYPVDARGLLNTGQFQLAFSATSRGAPPRPDTAAGQSSTQRRQSVPGDPGEGTVSRVPEVDSSFPRKNIETMNELAGRTGGLAFYNTNELVGSVRRAADDTDYTYSLGYHPPHNKWDGKFREIRVEVKRPGVRLRFRRGYFATPDRAVEPKDRDALVREAAAASFDATQLGIEAKVEPGAGRVTRLRLKLNAAELKLTQEGDRWVGGLEFLFVARDAQGKALGGLRDGGNMRLSQATYEQIGKNGLRMTKELEIPDGAIELRVVVLDPNNGNIGSLSVPLKGAAVPAS